MSRRRDRSHGRLASVVTLAVLSLGVLAAGQGPAPDASGNPPASGTGLVAGRVVDAVTAKPVGGVSLSIGGGANASFSYFVGPTGQPQINGPGRSQSPTGAPRQVLTDSEGRFVFYGFSKGNYVLRTTGPPAYLVGGYGQNRPYGPVQPITLATDDTKIGDLTIRIWKTAVIAGTVIDEAAEPVVGIGVTIFRRTVANGQLRLASVATASTDDRGMYRVATLGPGDYVVGVLSLQTTMPGAVAIAAVNTDVFRTLSGSGVFPSMGGYRIDDLVLTGNAGRTSVPAPAPTDDGKVFVYPTTFHPSAGAASQAAVVKLTAGEERSGVDVQLKLVPALRVSGTVIGPDGPVPTAVVRLTSADGVSYSGFAGPGSSNNDVAIAVADGTGAFTFLGVTPGQYTLRVVRVPQTPPSQRPPGMTTIEISGPNGQMMGVGMMNMAPGALPPLPPPLPTDPTLSATLSISAGEADIRGVSVTLRPAAHLNGRVQFDGASQPPTPAQLQRAGISITSLETRPFNENPQARVDAEGRFTTGGIVAGRYLISGASVNVQTGPTGSGQVWTFKSATQNGRSLSDDPFEVGEDDIPGILITFTDRTTQISGAVTDGKGQPDKTAEVVVLPADSQSWKDGLPNTRRTRSARPSSLGVYEFSGLPPGEYFVAALSEDTTVDLQDSKFLESAVRVATRVTLADGGKMTQDLAVKTLR